MNRRMMFGMSLVSLVILTCTLFVPVRDARASSVSCAVRSARSASLSAKLLQDLMLEDDQPGIDSAAVISASSEMISDTGRVGSGLDEEMAKVAMHSYLQNYASRNSSEVPALAQVTFEEGVAYGVARMRSQADSSASGHLLWEMAIQDNVDSADLIGLRSNKREDGSWEVVAFDSLDTSIEENLPVPFIPQVPTGDWNNTKNCGQTSSVMVYGYHGFYDHRSILAADIEAINDWLADEYDDDQYSDSNGWYTTASQLAKLAREYAYFTRSASASGWTLDQLRSEIDAGRPVVVAVYTGMDPNSNLGHFMVFRGYRTDDDGNLTQVIVNDPGKSAGDNNEYDVSTFLNSWQRQNRSVVVVRPNVVDLQVSLYAPSGNSTNRAPYERIIEYFADGVYESSNGVHKIGKVTFYTQGNRSDTSDIVWVQNCHPNAHISGRAVEGERVQMCDRFGATDFLRDDQSWQAGGYTLAHEWGHYYYSLYDEYRGDGRSDHLLWRPHSDDDAVSNSIMNSQWNAVGGNFEWLNFSTAQNAEEKTAQHRVYGASGWETLSRPLSEDPRSSQLASRPQRIYHPELSGAGPDSDNPTIMLPSEIARRDLEIRWATRDVTFQIVIDSSGSMGGVRLENAKTAAKLLVDLAEIGHTTIGIIKFSSTASVVLPLTPIDGQDSKNNIKAAIDAIGASGNTAIGTAAQLALDELVDYGVEETQRIVYLLTDGQNNAGIDPTSVIPDYQGSGIPLFTFGYGSGVDHAQLQQMASETGGVYYASPTTLDDLQQVFQDASQLSTNVVGVVAGTTDAISSTATVPFSVDATIDRMHISASYPGSIADVSLVLYDPVGNPDGLPDCAQSAGEVLCLFTVDSPPAGRWSLEALAEGGPVNVSYRVSGLAEDEITYYTTLTSLNGDVVRYPEPIVLLAILGKELPISGAVVTATLRQPDGSMKTFQLVDDGVAPDAVADDGNYSAILDYTQGGVHTVLVQFSNSAGTAEMTPYGLAFFPGPEGEVLPAPDPVPIGEDFERFMRLQVDVQGMQPDDHGNTTADATVIWSDNQDTPGRIDYQGDVDVFELTSGSPGELIIRVTDLALGMEPRLRVLAADGVNVLADVDLETSATLWDYVYLPIEVAAGDILFAEVSNRDGAGQGYYNISVGRRLFSDQDWRPRISTVYLPLSLRNHGTPQLEWSPTNGLRGRTVYALACVSSDCLVQYAGADEGLYRSSDGGLTWSQASLDGVLVSSIAVNPAVAQAHYVGTWGDGVYVSVDQGATWRSDNAGLGDSQWVYAIEIASDGARYLGTYDAGVFSAPAGSNVWSPANQGLDNLRVRSLLIDPLDPLRLYAGVTDGVYVSTTGGTNWSSLGTTLANRTVWSLAHDPLDASKLYAGTNDGVYRIASGVTSWVPMGLVGQPIYAVAPHPVDTSRIYVATKEQGVYRSTDAGMSWHSLGDAIGSDYVETLLLRPGVLQAGTHDGVWVIHE
jgi:calcium-activated chloride channel regulator 3/4